ncbi:MAG: response regulator [Anaerolineales bacterium]|nr:response regulator [Anaerolineales bacterium]
MPKARLLVVEDQAIIALDLQNRLAGLGYAVVAVEAYAEAALQQAERLRPDLVLMDIRLKGAMDGIQAAELIRAEQDLPVIYLTAHSDEATLQRARLTEPYGYILKPFEDRELQLAIEIALYKHQAEQKLKSHERWQAAVLQGIGDGVITTDTAGHITFLNPQAEALTGWPQAEALGISVEAVARLSGDPAPAAGLFPLRQAVEEDRVIAFPAALRLVTRAGHVLPVEGSAAPIRDARGQPAGAVLVLRDATDRMRAEAERAEYTAQVAALYQAASALIQPGHTPSALAGRIADTVVREFAMAGCAVWLPEDGASEPAWQLAAQAGQPCFQAAQAAGLPVSLAVQQRQAIYWPEATALSGPDGHNSALAVPLHRPAAPGQILGVLAMCRSGRDALDERLQRLILTFTEKAALALENARLVMSLEQAAQEARQLAAEAEAASRLKSQFLANTSHELRTPLTAILGTLGLVLSGHCDDHAEELRFVQMACTAAENLLGTVNDLLDTAKIEAGRLEPEVQALALETVLQEAHTLFAGQARAKALDFQLAIEPPAPAVLADAQLLRRILANLLSNAVKFTERGSVALRAAADPAGAHVIITVEDTGIGVALERQARLFQPFVQADGSVTRRYGGTGLGLNLARRLAELLGGSLEFYSAGPGQGSRLTLRLPAARLAA